MCRCVRVGGCGCMLGGRQGGSLAGSGPGRISTNIRRSYPGPIQIPSRSCPDPAQNFGGVGRGGWAREGGAKKRRAKNLDVMGVRTHDVRIRTRFVDHSVNWVPIWKWSIFGGLMKISNVLNWKFSHGGDLMKNHDFQTGKMVADGCFFKILKFFMGATWWKITIFKWGKWSRMVVFSKI